MNALAELLCPGGLLILTLDNPLNPLFHPLRWFSQRGHAPFPIGYTPPIGRLRRDLEAAGLAVEAEDWLIHNPRGLSTALFLALARVLQHRADPLIGALLSGFALLDRLPSRRLTACFQAVAARKAKEAPAMASPASPVDGPVPGGPSSVRGLFRAALTAARTPA